MVRGVILIGALVSLLAMPALAAGAGHGGNYDPFPASANAQAAATYYGKLAKQHAAGKPQAKSLVNGQFVGTDLATAAGKGPSQRAGAGGGISTALLVLVVAGAALLGSAATALLLSRRTAARAAPRG